MGEIASRRIVKDNQKKIVENLIEGKIMFEDQFEDPITRTTVAEIRRIIEEEYGLEEESISYMEIPINGEWKYVFWRNVEENVISLDDIKEMARIHFTKQKYVRIHMRRSIWEMQLIYFIKDKQKGAYSTKNEWIKFNNMNCVM